MVYFEFDSLLIQNQEEFLWIYPLFPNPTIKEKELIKIINEYPIKFKIEPENILDAYTYFCPVINNNSKTVHDFFKFI